MPSRRRKPRSRGWPRIADDSAPRKKDADGGKRASLACVSLAEKRASPEPSARQIEAMTKELHDWRSRTLARVRALIEQVDPDVAEESKWRKASNPAGVPVWSHAGIICTCETYKDKVKLTFAKGAALKDPSRLFNSGLEGNARRAIDMREGDTLDEEAFKALVRAAIVLNRNTAANRR